MVFLLCRVADLGVWTAVDEGSPLVDVREPAKLARGPAVSGFVFVVPSRGRGIESPFRRFWTASTIDHFGSPVTGFAVQILVGVNLQPATPRSDWSGPCTDCGA